MSANTAPRPAGEGNQDDFPLSDEDRASALALEVDADAYLLPVSPGMLPGIHTRLAEFIRQHRQERGGSSE